MNMRSLAVLGLSLVLMSCGDVPAEPTADGSPAAEVAAAPDPADSLTAPQKNARRSAENYLSYKGFSREGLIEQLSSDAGEGFAKADAIAAVDSMTVDWNEQAAKSAENYLSFKGFSCKGLIEQLSSSAGDGFTREQAEFGAKKAGAC